MEPWVMVVTLIAVAVSFTVSASAGLGGSLVLVPILALVLGTKEGVALAALLLAANNVVKVFAYRETLPLRKALVVIVLIAAGAALGGLLLVSAPERVVTVAVIVSFVIALLAERLDLARLRRIGGPVLAVGSGATSGFSGTSGPLKGMAIRQLELDRAHFVGAASLTSLAGDATKATVFTEAGLLSGDSFLVALAAVPLMLVATITGKRINRSIGERGYTSLFWGIMAGYTVRLVLTL
ncbi:MAG: TSUP family transporter [Acidimicrobiia bacterium]|nr:TSUP family transporter [Acidimicrobiia bacterium]MDQ3499529.1 TSUP family transporter [Actinomycetota bacterium]